MKTTIFALFFALAASAGTLFGNGEGTCGANLRWSYKQVGKTLCIKGWGYMDNYTETTKPWKSYEIQSLLLEDGLSIGNYAFYNCSHLTYLPSFPSGLESIGESAFGYCTSLPDMGSIPNSVTSIGRYAFYKCSSLTSITIPNNVTSIEMKTFYGCSSLNSVTIGRGVTSIGERAFYNCSSLTSITIPNNVTSIWYEAFYGCSSLTSVVWNAKNCNACDFGSQVKSFVFGDEVEVIPNGLCSGMNKLTSITIPNSVTSIGDRAFEFCRSLTSLTIGNSVTSIGKQAFKDCTGLTSVTCEAVNPPALGTNVFYNVPCGKIPLYVPKNSVDAYKAADQWKTFNSILPIGGSQETTYTVRFMDWNGTILKEESVVEGTSATAPEDPVYADHIFTGWDKDFSDVHSDMTITAVYRPDLGPDATKTNTKEVVITPIENGGVVIEWPAMITATSFTIEIKKEGKLIYTFTFNEKGQLISVTPAAPSRRANSMQFDVSYTMPLSFGRGWKYTIMGLEANEEYTCTITIKGGNNATLLSQTISFTAVSVTAIEDVFRDKDTKGDVQKIVYNGQLYILRDGKAYTATGAEVK